MSWCVLVLNAHDASGCSALQYALGESNHLQLLQLLLSSSADVDVDVVDKNGVSPLHTAIMHPSASFLLTKLLIEKGANIGLARVKKVTKTVTEEGVSKEVEVRSHANDK